MAASDEILQQLLTSPPEVEEAVRYQFLVPNYKGFENFIRGYQAHLKSVSSSSRDADTALARSSPAQLHPAIESLEVSIFTAATESFSQKNTNCSIAESLERFKPILAAAKSALPVPLTVRAYISVALGCPFEGVDVKPAAVADLAVSLLEMGADEISVGDTTGMGTAPRTSTLLKTLKSAGVEMSDIAMHFHDTFGQALVNSVVSLDHGVRKFDSAVGGLGGCPYSPGATGNVATEDLVYLFSSLGAHTGVDLESLAETGEWISGEVGRQNASSAGKALLARRRRQREAAGSATGAAAGSAPTKV